MTLRPRPLPGTGKKKVPVRPLTALFLALVLFSSVSCGKAELPDASGESVPELTETEENQRQDIPDNSRAPSEESSTVPESENRETGIPEDTEPVPETEAPPPGPESVTEHYSRMFIASRVNNFLNVRNEPTKDGFIIGKLLKNSGGEILEDTGNGWYRIRSGGIEGYVNGSLVLTGQQAKDQALRYENMWIRITAGSLNVRMEPTTEAGILARVTGGQTYRVVREEGDWYRITIGSEEGYVSRDYAMLGYTVAQAENWNQIANLSGPALTMAQWGMQYLGLRYVFGGESMSTGVDCSYFTGMCMSQVGIRLPRTSREQAERGTPVAIQDMRPGDLLFYATHGTIDHVALYIGDNKILHAAQSIGCVSISAYNYCGEPVAIRRYF